MLCMFSLTILKDVSLTQIPINASLLGDDEFGYNFLDREKWQVIRNWDVIFNEKFIYKDKSNIKIWWYYQWYPNKSISRLRISWKRCASKGSKQPKNEYPQQLVNEVTLEEPKVS